MSDMNVVCLVGRLTKDPEVRQTQNGKTVCSFTVASNRPKSKDGEEKADFLSCVVWESSADYLGRYGHKGDKVSVQGRLQSRKYDNTDGRTVWVTEVLVRELSLLKSKESGSDSMTDMPTYLTGGGTSIRPKDMRVEGVEGDDLPF